HAHFCALSPGGDWLIVTDLGTDQLRAYPLDEGMPEDEPVHTALPAGFGPRHLAMTGDHLYVAGELSGEIATIDWDEGDGQGEVVHTEAAWTADGLHQLTHIERSGDLLFVGVRGADTLATLAISGDGASTRLLGEVTTAAWPRHLSVAGEYVLVAGENADEVAVHPVTNGQAGEATDRIAVPGPMCVLPMGAGCSRARTQRDTRSARAIPGSTTQRATYRMNRFTAMGRGPCRHRAVLGMRHTG